MQPLRDVLIWFNSWFNLISDFSCSSQKPHFQFFNAFWMHWKGYFICSSISTPWFNITLFSLDTGHTPDNVGSALYRQTLVKTVIFLVNQSELIFVFYSIHVTLI